MKLNLKNKIKLLKNLFYYCENSNPRDMMLKRNQQNQRHLFISLKNQKGI